jgi:hypothetical protein
MRKAMIASALALLGLAVPARAMPIPAFSDAPSAATMVAFGCGPGWTRGPYGHCHPMGWGYPAYGYGYRYGPVRHCWRGPWGALHCRWY